MHILVTRPEIDAAMFKERLEALGHRVTVDSLMRIEPCMPATIPPGPVDAVAATSRNAMRALAGHSALAELTKLPLFVVGPGTAEIARGLGFVDVTVGSATAADLVLPIGSRLSGPGGRVLHVRGEKTAFDLASALMQLGISIEEIVAYRQVPAERLSLETIAALTAGSLDIVVLMSPLTAATFIALARAAGLGDAAGRVRYACLSARIAETMAALPAAAEVAVRPRAEEMLALVVGMAAKSAAGASRT